MRFFVLFIALFALNACMAKVDGPATRDMSSSTIMKLGATHYADIEQQVLISSQTSGDQDSLSFCETYAIEHELRSVDINFDCQLSDAYVIAIKRAFDIYHARLMDSLASESFYRHLDFDDAKLCLFLVRPNVRYNKKISVEPCYSLYFSAYPYEPPPLAVEHAEDFEKYSYLSLANDVYGKFFHELFHLEFGSNDINARYSVGKPYVERTTNELLASLLELDIQHRLGQIQLADPDLAMTSSIAIEFVPSFPLLQQCSHEQQLVKYQESYRSRPDIFYTLLGSDYAQILYHQVQAVEGDFSEYVALVFQYLRKHDDFIERAYTFCENEPTPMEFLGNWNKRRSIKMS